MRRTWACRARSVSYTHLDVYKRQLLGRAFRWFDSTVIDKGIVDGSAELVGEVGVKMRKLQNGRLYSYAFAMIIGLIVLLGWLIRTWM